MASSGEEADVSGSGPASSGTGYSGHGVQLEEVEGKGHPIQAVGENLKLNEVRGSCADQSLFCWQMPLPFPPQPRPPRASQVALRVKNPPVNAEDLRDADSSLGWEDHSSRAWQRCHSSALAGESPWTEKAGRLQSMGSQRVGHD